MPSGISLPPLSQWIKLLMVMTVLVGCSGVAPVTTGVATAQELRVAGWADDLNPEVLEAFTTESGITISYVPYNSQDDTIAALRKGEVYDVVVMSNENVALLAGESLLAPLEKSSLPNFKNISPNFRNLAYDPNNTYSVPYNWGTDGIIVRTDLVEWPITSWADLSTLGDDQKIIMWPTTRFTIATALKALGYPTDSENPAELDAARQWLLDIRPHVIFVAESDTASTVPAITSGEAVVALNAGVREAIEAQETGAAVEWVLPTEGSLLWGDNFAIPTASQHKNEAHRFIDFLLRPENGAKLAEWSQYATPNDAALPLMDPAIATNPLIYPSFADRSNVEVVLPVSTEAYQRYLEIWDEFVAGGQ